jgi:hypothetical protein
MVRFDDDPARAVADFHTGFNPILAARCWPILGRASMALSASAMRDASREVAASAIGGVSSASWSRLRVRDCRRIGEVRLDDVPAERHDQTYLASLYPEALWDADHRGFSQILG